MLDYYMHSSSILLRKSKITCSQGYSVANSLWVHSPEATYQLMFPKYNDANRIDTLNNSEIIAYA